jgi:predicted type IV restriction endonuclease
MRVVPRMRRNRSANKLLQLGGQAQVVKLLSKTQIEPGRFPLVIATLQEDRLQRELAVEFGVSRATVARLKRLALKRLEHFGITISAAWPLTRVIVPAPLATKLTNFSEAFANNHDDQCKRSVLERAEAHIRNATSVLEATHHKVKD